MNWRFATDRPIYSQIVEQIQRGILVGIYPPGSCMPSVRALALEAEVNPNTMQKALSELEMQGLLHTQRTSGRTVTADSKLITKLQENAAHDCIKRYFADMLNLGIDRRSAKSMIIAYVDAYEQNSGKDDKPDEQDSEQGNKQDNKQNPETTTKS